MTDTGDTDETVLLEHPNRTNQQFKRVEPKTPLKETAVVFRFQTKLPAKRSAEFEVTEGRELGEEVVLTNRSDNDIRFVLNLKQSGDKLKGQLTEALKKNGNRTR